MPINQPLSRVRVLRGVTGRSREQFADACGINSFSLRSVELGKRTLSDAMAVKIALATGVSRPWLLGEVGHSATPVTPLLEPYIRAHYDVRRAGRIKRAVQPEGTAIDLDGEIADTIDDACWLVTRFIRAAGLRGDLQLARALLAQRVADLAKELGIGRHPSGGSESITTLDRYLFGGSNGAGRGCDAYKQNPEGVTANVRLLSPLGRLKWADTFTGRYPDRRRFLRELDALRDIIRRSFDDRCPQVPSKKPSSARVPVRRQTR